jgi:hypothetical protein
MIRDRLTSLNEPQACASVDRLEAWESGGSQTEVGVRLGNLVVQILASMLSV